MGCLAALIRIILTICRDLFIKIATHLNFSQASEVQLINQPAISKHFKAIEERYRTKLFEWRGHTIALTAAGSLIHDWLLLANNVRKQPEFVIDSFR
jgi:hypothetical protein